MNGLPAEVRMRKRSSGDLLFYRDYGMSAEFAKIRLRYTARRAVLFPTCRE